MNLIDATLERFMALHPRLMDLSLDRLYRLLKVLGDPHLKLPPTIHVAGTNGKGSTIAFMRAILEADGKTVHVYTSPHLVRFNERIRLGAPGGGRLVDDATLMEAMNKVEHLNDKEPITVFEITTAIAFQLFAEHPADFLLLEVGLGGRMDATNVVEAPIASVISKIAMDHEAFLGDHVDQIAGEKAGIIKSGCPVVSAAQEPSVQDVLTRHAARHKAPIVFADEDFSILSENGRLLVQSEDSLLDLPLPRLLGRHQLNNAGLALAALKAAGIEVSPRAAEIGIQAADWPARLQRLKSGRLVDRLVPGAELWIDGGHNPNAGEALALALADLEERCARPLFMICGMLNTKDPVGYLAPFAGLARHLFAVPVRSTDAGRAPEELVDIAENAGLSAETASDPKSVLNLLAKSWIKFEQPPRILVCGSLYLAGEVLSENGTLID